MKRTSYSGYRFPPEIINRAVWLYLRFTLGFRDVEDLLAERGVGLSYETIRRWVNHFGPTIAADLRKRRPKPHTTWHLDEACLKIDGRLVYLWRAVDAEGEVLDVLVQAKRDKHAALKLMRTGTRAAECFAARRGRENPTGIKVPVRLQHGAGGTTISTLDGSTPQANRIDRAVLTENYIRQ